MSGLKGFHIARGISEFGNALRQVVLALVFFQFRRDPSDIQFAEVFETLGFIIAMTLAPFFIDHYSKKAQLLVCDLLSSLFVIGLMFAMSQSLLPLAFAAAFFLTGLGALHSASLTALAQQMGSGINTETILGIGRIHLVLLVGALLGLILGSQLVNKMDLKIFLVIDVLTFLISTCWMLFIIKKETGDKISDPKKVSTLWLFLKNRLQDWKSAVRIILSKFESKILIIASIINGIAVGIYESSSVPMQKIIMDSSDQSLFYVRILNRVAGISVIVLIYYWTKSKSNDHKVAIFRATIFTSVLASVGMLYIPSYGKAGFFAFNAVYCFAMSGYYLFASVLQSSFVEKTHLGKIESLRSLLGYFMVLVGNTIAIPLFKKSGGLLNFKIASGILLVLATWWTYSYVKSLRRTVNLREL